MTPSDNRARTAAGAARTTEAAARDGRVSSAKENGAKENGESSGAPPRRAPVKPSSFGQSAAREPASRHYRRAQRDRGAETRTRLLEAALDVFGRLGFEGATTRQIAKEAGANLAAIVYHFGSKEALHLAVAEHVGNQMRESTAGPIGKAGDANAIATPEAARAAFSRLIEAYVDVILGKAEAERWSRFIVREMMRPSAAFDVIYGIMGNTLSVATRLIAASLRRPEDEEARLRAFAMFGQVLVFRVAHALVLRHMDWVEIGEPERARIKRIVVDQATAILAREDRT